MVDLDYSLYDESTVDYPLHTGLTKEEVRGIWKWLWESQKQSNPSIVAGIADADVEMIVKPVGWNKTFRNECGIGVYWVFDNTEYGAWVAVQPKARVVICNPLRLNEGVPTYVSLSDVLANRNDGAGNPLMLPDADISFLTNKE